MSTEKEFLELVQLIQYSRNNALRAINAELINLYWNVGKYISNKLMSSSWGEKTIDALANFIQTNHSELKGFNRRGLYRMKQFYETYASYELASRIGLEVESTKKVSSSEIVSAVRTQLNDIRSSVLGKLSWTHHRTIFSRCKSHEEIEFYLKMSVKENYTARELERQISSSLFERVMMGDLKFSPALRETFSNVHDAFKFLFGGFRSRCKKAKRKSFYWRFALQRQGCRSC